MEEQFIKHMAESENGKDLKLTVVINGPKGSGKDELAGHLAKVFGNVISVHHQEFKNALYEQAANVANVKVQRIKELNGDRSTKEVVTEELKVGGVAMSPRQLLIHTSENIIKPVWGSDYFGKRAAQSLRPGLNVFSDCGFADELVPICDEASPENVLIVRLIRPDHTFDGDSRSYIASSDLFMRGIQGVSIDPLYNAGSLEEFHKEGVKIVREFLLGRLKEYWEA